MLTFTPTVKWVCIWISVLELQNAASSHCKTVLPRKTTVSATKQHILTFKSHSLLVARGILTEVGLDCYGATKSFKMQSRVDGWINKMSGLNTSDRCLFPISHLSGYYCNHDDVGPLTLTK